MGWIILIIAIALIAFWLVITYNKLISLRNMVKNGWAQIDVQLQRRYDLIPNLVESVKGYMNHEKSTLEGVVEARNQASAARKEITSSDVPEAEAMKRLMGAEATLKQGLGNIFALAENYPDLKASQNMLELQEELKNTENRVAFSRQGYNDTAMAYNIAQERFPTNLVAKTFGHHQAELYEVKEEKAKEAVKVSF